MVSIVTFAADTRYYCFSPFHTQTQNGTRTFLFKRKLHDGVPKGYKQLTANASPGERGPRRTEPPLTSTAHSLTVLTRFT